MAEVADDVDMYKNATMWENSADRCSRSGSTVYLTGPGPDVVQQYDVRRFGGSTRPMASQQDDTAAVETTSRTRVRPCRSRDQRNSRYGAQQGGAILLGVER